MDHGFYNPYLLNKLDTIDAEELMATPYAPKNFIVADMLPEGLTLLCGPSKIGKSWFVLQLCLCVALGKMFLGHNLISSDVLYLCNLWLNFKTFPREGFKIHDSIFFTGLPSI